MKRLEATALELVTDAHVAEAAELDPARWRRLRAATCEVSGLPAVELDRQALRVFRATDKQAPARRARDLGGGTAHRAGREES